MECTVSNSMANVSWYKGEKKLEDGDMFSISKDLSGICRLAIKLPRLDDSGPYSCRIDKQTEKTETTVEIIGQYHSRFYSIEIFMQV